MFPTLAGALRRLRLNRPIYSLCSLRYQHSPTPPPPTAQAEEYLQSVWPDCRSSALTVHHIHEYEADLQIIVPAYNAAATIEECLRSILTQRTRRRILLVVVDDGSTDSTPGIVRSFSSDSRLRIITQENQGFSGARNAGMRHLYAPYLAFVDADDSLPPHAIDTLLDAAETHDADIVQGSYQCFSRSTVRRTVRFPSYSGDDFTRLHGTPWAKVYRSSLFLRLGFPPHYWFEDTLGPLLLHPLAHRVVTLPRPVYLYRDNPQGISHRSHGQPRNVEALWVTRSLLADGESLGIPRTPLLLKSFLIDTRCTLHRLTAVPDARLQVCALSYLSSLMLRYFHGVTPPPLPFPLRALHELLRCPSAELLACYRRWG